MCVLCVRVKQVQSKKLVFLDSATSDIRYESCIHTPRNTPPRLTDVFF